MKNLNYVALALLTLASACSIAERQPQQEPAAEKPVGKPKAYAVASAHYLATNAGMEVLAAGGNAFDAAVAVSAALAVVEPASSGLGGGGFWLLYLADEQRSIMVDGRETAPAAATEDMYINADGSVNRTLALTGATAAAIPGEPAALDHIAQNYGNLALALSLQPAITLAANGFPVDAKYRDRLVRRDRYKRLSPAAAKVLVPNGVVPQEGELIRQEDLAQTMRMLATHGSERFYQGEFARQMVAAVVDAGGIWSEADLASYRVVEREPITTTFGPYRLVSAPPPSSGGIVLAQVFNILDGYPYAQLEKADQVHITVEAMRRAFRDRAIYLGDPDFVPMPMSLLTSDQYAAGLRAAIRMDKAMPSDMLPGIESQRERPDTTHFSVIDSDGNMVAATLTINLGYGSGFMVPGTGVLLNNEMDDFSSKPGVPNAFGLIGDHANAIAPGKRPLSSMAPTFVFGPDRVAALGSQGGSRIISSAVLMIQDFMAGNEPESWVSLPRYHHQYLPDRISAEPTAFDQTTLEDLRSRGHQVDVSSRTWSNSHGVMWNLETGEVTAGSDPRWASGRAEVGRAEVGRAEVGRAEVGRAEVGRAEVGQP